MTDSWASNSIFRQILQLEFKVVMKVKKCKVATQIHVKGRKNDVFTTSNGKALKKSFGRKKHTCDTISITLLTES